MEKFKDAYGREIYDYYQGNGGFEVIESETGYIDLSGGSVGYFADYKSWPPFEKKAIRFAWGKVVDIGCGAGRVALYLQQKGVDVLLSIDLVRNASINTKNFILVACDTDFVPAINDIRVKDKVKVILYYFRNRDSKFSMSDHILSVCDKSVRLKKEDFEKAKF